MARATAMKRCAKSWQTPLPRRRTSSTAVLTVVVRGRYWKSRLIPTVSSSSAASTEAAERGAARQPPDARGVGDRGPEEKEVVRPLAVVPAPRGSAGLDLRAAGHLDQLVGGGVVEVMHVVAEAVPALAERGLPD